MRYNYTVAKVLLTLGTQLVLFLALELYKDYRSVISNHKFYVTEY